VSKLSLLIAVFFSGLVAFCLFVFANWFLAEEKMRLGPPEDPDEMDMPWITAGIYQPQVESADTDKIKPEQKVIGILLEDKARAYMLAAFDGIERTVVNDVIKGTPVTITYYPMESLHNEPEKRVRVFCDNHGSEALMMGLMGTEEGKMKIYCQEKGYFQMGSKVSVWHDSNKDGKEDPDEMFQLADLEFEVVNWKDWKENHPDTDVYLGKGIKGETPASL